MSEKYIFKLFPSNIYHIFSIEREFGNGEFTLSEFAKCGKVKNTASIKVNPNMVCSSSQNVRKLAFSKGREVCGKCLSTFYGKEN